MHLTLQGSTFLKQQRKLVCTFRCLLRQAFMKTGEVSGQMSVKKSSVWVIFPLLDAGLEELDMQMSK